MTTNPLKKEFLKQVNKHKSQEGCWIYTGESVGKNCAYGIFRSTLAHRFSYYIHKGEIPAGMSVLHNCPGGDNLKCVNPAHLWIGNKQDNINDMIKKGRQKKVTILNALCVETIQESYYVKKVSVERLSELYDVSKTVIYRVLTGTYIAKKEPIVPVKEKPTRVFIPINKPKKRITYKELSAKLAITTDPVDRRIIMDQMHSDFRVDRR